MDRRINDLAITMTQYDDILRFNKLSNGFLVKHPKDENVLGDIRYAMLPNGAEPLWGIRLNPDNRRQHATEALFRDFDAKTRASFFTMLQGKPL